MKPSHVPALDPFPTLDATALAATTGGKGAPRHRGGTRDPWANNPYLEKTGANSYRVRGGGGGTAFRSSGENLGDAVGIGLWGLGASLGMGAAALFGD